MSKWKSLIVMHVGDPRGKFAVKKTKKMNIEWNNKYNASKIDIPSSGQRRFADM